MELLVVMCAISTLMAILQLAVYRAREQGRIASCLANLRSIGQGIVPYARDNDHVFFCPSGKPPDGRKCYEGFAQGWGRGDVVATTSYMHNNALGGFDGFVQNGQIRILSHKNKINFLRGDGSVDTFNVRRLAVVSIAFQKFEE